ncbi:hypothetical protein VRU48_17395 [Pedobacter sp. KR3-3]|uniref:Bacteriocin n=1 Tax=Pedobacter albus TaxID=3113905 RepID=A0ABU7IBP2_9SPHI|nr:hypothetical protein [Pedobacter sp. KR3-3]MEE1946905.1 hypothetical protein [Pedobacter sp. KR3-3]
MKALNKSEMKEILGGVAAGYYCCAYTFDPANGDMYHKCGITIEDAQARVEQETNNGWFSYYECGVERVD